MSWQAVDWALNDAPHLLTDAGRPDTTARGVLVALAEKAGEDGADAYPSPLRVHYMTGYDVRTVQRALDRLEAGGLIARDGFSQFGTINWKLATHLERPDSEWDNLLAEADKHRREESAKRQARRTHQASTTGDVSGTQNPGHPEERPGRKMPDIRHAESRMSGTQRPPNHPVQPPFEPPTGGAPPPDPRGPDDPSGHRTENLNSFSEGQDPLAQDQESNHRPRAREDNRRCVHGNNPRKRRDGSFRCPECQASAAGHQADDALPEAEEPQPNPPTNVIPFGRRSA